MKKLLKMTAAFCLLFVVAFIPISGFAHTDSGNSKVIPMKTNEIQFYNDTSSLRTLKLKYRSLLGSVHHIHVDIYPGELYTFDYGSTSWDKWAKVRGHNWRKVQSGDVWNVSSLLD